MSGTLRRNFLDPRMSRMIPANYFKDQLGKIVEKKWNQMLLIRKAKFTDTCNFSVERSGSAGWVLDWRSKGCQFEPY